MLLPGPTIGIAITGATVGVLVIGFCRAPRQHAFSTQGWLGIAALAGAEFLLFHSIAPVPIYFTPIAWSAYMRLFCRRSR